MSKKLKKPSVRTVNHRDGGMSFYAEGGDVNDPPQLYPAPSLSFQKKAQEFVKQEDIKKKTPVPAKKYIPFVPPVDKNAMQSDNAKVAPSGPKAVYTADDLDYFEQNNVPIELRPYYKKQLDSWKAADIQEEKDITQRRIDVAKQAELDRSKGLFTQAVAEDISNGYRLSNNNNFIDSYLNPFQWVLNPAGNLAGNFAIDAGPIDPLKVAMDTGLLALGATGLKGTGNLFKPLLNKAENAVVRSTESGILSNAYKMNPWAFKPKSELFYRQIGEPGYLDALKEGRIFAKGQKEFLENDPKFSYWLDYNKAMNYHKKTSGLNLRKPAPAPFFQKGELFFPISNKTGFGRGKTKTSDIKYLLEGEIPEEGIIPRYVDKYSTREEFLKTGNTGVGVLHPNYNNLSNFNIYQKHWLQGYKKLPKESINITNPIQNKFNGLQALDKVIPRPLAPGNFLGMEDSWNNYSPLNLIPGYGEKLIDESSVSPYFVGFRKFGNSLDDVIESKTLRPRGTGMGSDQIMEEGNWAEHGRVNENYPGVFEATMNPQIQGSNIKLERIPRRNGIVGTTKEGDVAIPLTDPGLSFNRRLPFSNRYVPIDKQRLIDNQFQLATQLPYLQSLAEKYAIWSGVGLGAAYAGLPALHDANKKYIMEPFKKQYNNLDTALKNMVGIDTKKQFGGETQLYAKGGSIPTPSLQSATKLQLQRQREAATRQAELKEWRNNAKPNLNMPTLASENSKIKTSVNKEIPDSIYTKDDLDYFKMAGIQKKDWYNAKKQREASRLDYQNSLADKRIIRDRKETEYFANQDLKQGKENTMNYFENMKNDYRLFPNDPHSFIDALNPLQAVSNIAGNVGYQFAVDNPNEFDAGEFISNISPAVIMGLTGGFGAANGRQILNNIVNPFAGTGILKNTGSKLKNELYSRTLANVMNNNIKRNVIKPELQTFAKRIDPINRSSVNVKNDFSSNLTKEEYDQLLDTVYNQNQSVYDMPLIEFKNTKPSSFVEGLNSNYREGMLFKEKFCAPGSECAKTANAVTNRLYTDVTGQPFDALGNAHNAWHMEDQMTRHGGINIGKENPKIGDRILMGNDVDQSFPYRDYITDSRIRHAGVFAGLKQMDNGTLVPMVFESGANNSLFMNPYYHTFTGPNTVIEKVRPEQFLDNTFGKGLVDQNIRYAFRNKPSVATYSSNNPKIQGLLSEAEQFRETIKRTHDLTNDEFDELLNSVIGIGGQETKLNGVLPGSKLAKAKIQLQNSLNSAGLLKPIKKVLNTTKSTLNKVSTSKTSLPAYPGASRIEMEAAIYSKNNNVSFTDAVQKVKSQYQPKPKFTPSTVEPSKGMFRQKYQTNEDRLANFGDDLKDRNSLENALGQMGENYKKIKAAYPNATPRQLIDLTTLMWNSPGKAMNKDLVDFYMFGKNNPNIDKFKFDYINKVNAIKDKYINIHPQSVDDYFEFTRGREPEIQYNLGGGVELSNRKFEKGGEYELTQEEIDNLRSQGYDLELL